MKSLLIVCYYALPTLVAGVVALTLYCSIEQESQTRGVT